MQQSNVPHDITGVRLARAVGAVGLLMLCPDLSSAAGPVIRPGDLPAGIGTTAVYNVLDKDGSRIGEYTQRTEDNMHLGDAIVTQMRDELNGKLMHRSLRVLYPDRVEFFSTEHSRSPRFTLPLPLEIGKSLSFKSETGTGFVRVTKEETVSTPAGNFRCLVCTIEVNGQPSEVSWLAAHVGIVKSMGVSPRPYTSILSELKKPEYAAPPANSDVLVNFDAEHGSDLTACPNATWNPADCDSNRLSSTVLDATESALNTPRSLRWSYHARDGSWAAARIMLTGSWEQPIDLTQYASLSFYIKGFRSGKCAFSVQVQPTGNERDEYVLIPVPYTTEWRKVTVDLTSEDVSRLDLRYVVLLGLGHLGNDSGDNGNVIWIDEITGRRR